MKIFESTNQIANSIRCFILKKIICLLWCYQWTKTQENESKCKEHISGNFTIYEIDERLSLNVIKTELINNYFSSTTRLISGKSIKKWKSLWKESQSSFIWIHFYIKWNGCSIWYQFHLIKMLLKLRNIIQNLLEILSSK